MKISLGKLALLLLLIHGNGAAFAAPQAENPAPGPVQSASLAEQNAPAQLALGQTQPQPEPQTLPSLSPGLVLTSQAERMEARNFKRVIVGSRPKLGLALGGGGARGAAEVGVLKVLEKEGLHFDYVTGTSIGSVIGGFYCLGAKPAEMEEAFVKGEVMRHFMSVPLWMRLLSVPILLVPRIFGSKEYDGLYKGDVFANYLMAGMNDRNQKIEDMKIPFAAVALDLNDGKPYMIRGGSLGQAMQASCAVPSLRKPVEISGHLFADGGVICNVPVKQCREMGADIVIAVNIDEPFEPQPLSHFHRIGSVAKRMLDWGLYDIDDAQCQMADITIHPYTKGISLISTRRKDAIKGIQAGEEAATYMLPQLRQVLRDAGITAN